MKVLVVDDSRAMRTFLSNVARDLSLTPSEAADGREALSLLVRNDPREPFDLVLVDWDMPRMNGLELVKALRRNRDFAHTRLMMVTAHNSMDSVMQALESGADEFIMKPVTAEMLTEKLQILGLVESPYV